MELYINFGIHFWAFASVFFFITLAMRGLFIYKESYKITMRLLVVFICFGGELAMTYYPDVFMIHIANIVFALTGAIVAIYLAEAWSMYRYKKLREAHLPDSIFERYYRESSDREITETVME